PGRAVDQHQTAPHHSRWSGGLCGREYEEPSAARARPRRRTSRGGGATGGEPHVLCRPTDSASAAFRQPAVVRGRPSAATPQLTQLLAFVQLGLIQAAGQVPPEQKEVVGAVANFLAVLLRSAQIEQRDATVEVALKIEENVYAEQSARMMQVAQNLNK